MRIIILSIALLFCAFSAHSQVLKSAGVWYFLDVDSMTARPAVLPNGTELAYVVGTKTVYYWNRNTSTWTAYGSTFNRDSIYFDSSIVGSGTASDPWGVDSTLFATIQAVGDSIMAEKQTLSFASPLLGISDGNNVDLSPLLSGYVTGSGTNNRVPKWSALTNITDSNIQDDGTAVSILSSKPFLLGQWTTAGRPTGVNGYAGFNTSFNWPEWYSSSGWFSPLQSSLTGGLGTAGSIVFLDANGRATQDNANLFWNNSTKRLGIGTASPSQAFEIYTPLTTSVNLAKFQGGHNPVANILFNVTGFQSTISGHLMKMASTQGTAPYIDLRNGIAEIGWGTTASTNRMNVLSALNVTGEFGFSFLSGARVHKVLQNTSFLGGYDRGVDIATYDHRTDPTSASDSKGDILLRLTPSKEVWVGDKAVNNAYSFLVSQPGLGYGRLTTTAGSAVINGYASSTYFTRDFNVGSTLTINGNSYTVLSIATDAQMTLTATVPTTGEYAYTITGSTDRIGVYKNGGVIITPATGQPRYELTISGTQGVSVPRGTVAQRPTIVTSTTPIRFNTDSTALEYGESVGTWRQIATRAYARSLVAGLGTGTVTSVGLSLPSIFSVSGSPITTSGTLSATFTGGSASQFLRGDGRWMKSLYFNSADSIQFNITDPYFGSTALVSMKGNDGSFDSRFNIADYGYVNQALAISTNDDARYIFDRARGTIASPTALLKDDRIGGIYFNAHNGTSYRKTGYIGAVVDSIHSGANPQSKLIFGTSEINSPETSSYWRFLIESLRNISVVNHVTGESMGVGFGSDITILENTSIDARFHVKGAGTTTDKTMLLEDSGGADILTVTDNKLIQAHGYGTSATTAAALGLTESGYVAGFDPNGKIYSKAISSLSNGIYSNSATLANHTTRARVPDDGNLFFSQTYNGGADSSFFYFANATSGERYVGLGMTDTASTGGASLLFGNDGGGEMSFDLVTIDAVNGNTQVRGIGGDLLMSSSSGNISLSTNVANEVRVTGLVRAKQEAYYEITSTSSPQTFSNDYSDNFVNQGGTQASFTFLFPASPEDGQILSMTWNNAISVLTLDGNGNTITGTAVTTAVAGTRRQFKYYASASAWIKIY